MVQQPLFRRVAVFGVGLLGGSIGLACHQQKLCEEVIGIGRNQGALDEAIRLGAIDRSFTDVALGVREADLVVICTPVRHIISVLPQVMSNVPSGAIVTDVGSTKASIVSTGEEAGTLAGRLFVGSHPMAGSERSGVRNARADLYSGTTCFVTKTEQTDMDAFVRVANFWRMLDARVVMLRPERHDRLVALVSHLPHLIAVSLVRAIDQSHEDKNLIKGIIGNGFRDTTRIAAGSIDLWDDICADNTDQIQATREQFLKAFGELVVQCRPSNSELRDMLEEASDYRKFLDMR